MRKHYEAAKRKQGLCAMSLPLRYITKEEKLQGLRWFDITVESNLCL